MCTMFSLCCHHANEYDKIKLQFFIYIDPIPRLPNPATTLRALCRILQPLHNPLHDPRDIPKHSIPTQHTPRRIRRAHIPVEPNLEHGQLHNHEQDTQLQRHRHEIEHERAHVQHECLSILCSFLAYIPCLEFIFACWILTKLLMLCFFPNVSFDCLL